MWSWLGVVALVLGLLSPVASAQSSWSFTYSGGSVTMAAALSSVAGSAVTWNSGLSSLAGQTFGVNYLEQSSLGCVNAYVFSGTDGTGSVLYAAQDVCFGTGSASNVWAPGFGFPAGFNGSVVFQVASGTVALESLDASGACAYAFTTTCSSSGGALNTTDATFVDAWTAPPIPPAVPSGVTVVGGTGSASVSWSAVSGAASYLVLDSQSSSGPWAQAAAPTAASASITGLAGGTWWFEVESVSSAGAASAPSAAVSGSVATPPAPLSAAVLSVSETKTAVDLSWSALTGAVSYDVQRASASAGPWTALASVTGTSYVDTPAGASWYRVAGVDSYGTVGAWSNVAEGVPSAVPGLALPINLGNIVSAVGQTLGSLWPLLAFAVGVAVAFKVGDMLIWIGRQAAGFREAYGEEGFRGKGGYRRLFYDYWHPDDRDYDGDYDY